MLYPGFVVSLETSWDLFFLTLGSWLPELKGVKLADQNSILIQYMTKKGWRPLAGDKQLRMILHEFNILGTELYVRCAPEDEFRSSVDSSTDDDGATILLKSGRPADAKKVKEKIVSHAIDSVILLVLVANREILEAPRLQS